MSERTRLSQTGAQQGEGCSQGHVRLPRHQQPQAGRANAREKLRTSQLRNAAPRGRRRSRSSDRWSSRAEVAPAERCPAAARPRRRPRRCRRSCCCWSWPLPCRRAWQVSRGAQGRGSLAVRPRPPPLRALPRSPGPAKCAGACLSSGGAPRGLLGSPQPCGGSGTAPEEGIGVLLRTEKVLARILGRQLGSFLHGSRFAEPGLVLKAPAKGHLNIFAHLIGRYDSGLPFPRLDCGRLL